MPFPESTTASSSAATRTCSSAVAASPTPALSGCPTRTMSQRSGRSSTTERSSSGGHRSTLTVRSPRSRHRDGRAPPSSSPRTCAPRLRDARRRNTSRALPDRVVVGRVGRPHGIAGAFVVENPSDDPDRFAVGARLLAGADEAVVEESKRSGGRRVIRLDRPVPRGTSLEVERSALPEPAEDHYYVADLVGLEVE